MKVERSTAFPCLRLDVGGNRYKREGCGQLDHIESEHQKFELSKKKNEEKELCRNHADMQPEIARR